MFDSIPVVREEISVRLLEARADTRETEGSEERSPLEDDGDQGTAVTKDEPQVK